MVDYQQVSYQWAGRLAVCGWKVICTTVSGLVVSSWLLIVFWKDRNWAGS